MLGVVTRCRPRIALGMVASLLCSAVWASDQGFRPGAYDITAQTVMPHLEESLRYATTRERRCLIGHDLPSVFPILRHQSLEGCKLGDAGRQGDTIRYLLVCRNPQVATGTARLDTGPGRITGVLEIKMGGKNMTFSQRVEAARQGECGLAQ
jgi:hypothetical protein